jgi:serine/threonine protein kinase
VYAVGKMLDGRYRLEAVIGEGGMGRVWKAHDTRVDSEVAVKEVDVPRQVSSVETEEFYRQAIREARNAAKVRDLPDVVTVYDVVVEPDGRPWIVMQLLEDHLTLQQYIVRHGPLASDDLAKLAARLFAVVHQMHQRGIVHRDLKPGNLMVGLKKLIVLDFGIAKYVDDTLTKNGIVGTPSYMAPEYIQTGQPLPASDAWALGVVLYFALSGVLPFQRDVTIATIHAIVHDPYPPLEGDGPVHEVVWGLLQKDPNERLRLDDAVELLVGVRPPVTVKLPKKRPHRRKLAMGLAGVCAASGLAAGAVFIPTGDPEGDRVGESTSVTASTVSSAQQSNVAASTTASATPSPTAQVVGNVFVSDGMRVEAPAGWNVSVAQESVPEANLYKDGEGYMRVTRLNGSSLESLVQERRRNVSSGVVLSDVSYPFDDRAQWTYSEPRSYNCWDWPCAYNWVWSTVAKVDGGFVAVTYIKQAKRGDQRTGLIDTQVSVAIGNVIAGTKLL